MFHTILPHYRHVKPIVQRYETLYAQQFPQIKDWHVLGRLLLLELIQQSPDSLTNPLELQLTYRVAFVQILSLLLETKLVTA